MLIGARVISLTTGLIAFIATIIQAVHPLFFPAFAGDISLEPSREAGEDGFKSFPSLAGRVGSDGGHHHGNGSEEGLVELHGGLLFCSWLRKQDERRRSWKIEEKEVFSGGFEVSGVLEIVGVC